MFMSLECVNSKSWVGQKIWFIEPPPLFKLQGKTFSPGDRAILLPKSAKCGDPDATNWPSTWQSNIKEPTNVLATSEDFYFPYGRLLFDVRAGVPAIPVPLSKWLIKGLQAVYDYV